MDHLLDCIPFEIDLPALYKATRARPGSADARELERLAGEAQALARPRAACRAGFIEARGNDWVQADGVTFTSRVLRVHLERAQRVFAFVATCGPELEAWSRGFDDLLYRYWSDVICEQALLTAQASLFGFIDERYRLGKASLMTPGSLEDWPLEQQRPLFTLLGDLAAAAGVRLTGSLLMVPVKSLSGLRFSYEASFESCQLCPRPVCPARRAPYDPDLFDRRYRQAVPDQP